MRKDYKEIWRLILKASHIKSNSNLSVNIKRRLSTNLMHRSDKGSTGKRYANNILSFKKG